MCWWLQIIAKDDCNDGSLSSQSWNPRRLSHCLGANAWQYRVEGCESEFESCKIGKEFLNQIDNNNIRYTVYIYILHIHTYIHTNIHTYMHIIYMYVYEHARMLNIAVSLGGWMQNWPEFSGGTVESCFVIGFWWLRREQGYWVSYNSPFFKEIREVSGADDMEKRFGDAYSYTRNPRAKIFQRDTIHATEAWI